jgi:hypothetical protein
MGGSEADLTQISANGIPCGLPYVWLSSSEIICNLPNTTRLNLSDPVSASAVFYGGDLRISQTWVGYVVESMFHRLWRLPISLLTLFLRPPKVYREHSDDDSPDVSYLIFTWFLLQLDRVRCDLPEAFMELRSLCRLLIACLDVPSGRTILQFDKLFRYRSS